jgi:hypothetical protein
MAPVLPPLPWANAPSTRATISVVLGTIGIVAGLGQCCCCFAVVVNLACSVTAWVLAQQELRDIAAGRAPAAGQGHASAGRILGIIGVALAALYALALIGWISLVGLSEVADKMKSGRTWR